jgi:hypothetical protein
MANALRNSANSPSNSNIFEYLRQLSVERFWGSVTLKFERGEVVHLREERSLKPEELKPSGTPRLSDETDN